MNPAHEPLDPLPWAQDPGRDGTGPYRTPQGVVVSFPKNHEYIGHVANQYPHLVKALKEIAAMTSNAGQIIVAQEALTAAGEAWQ